MRLVLTALVLCLASSAIAKEPDYSNVGPAPDRETGLAMVEDAIRAQLKDPDSAQFTWPNGFRIGWYRPPFGKKYVGWITCGTVNARNSFGGYTGRSAAIGIISNGAVIATDIDSSAYRDMPFVGEACRKIGIPAR